MATWLPIVDMGQNTTTSIQIANDDGHSFSSTFRIQRPCKLAPCSCCDYNKINVDKIRQSCTSPGIFNSANIFQTPPKYTRPKPHREFPQGTFSNIAWFLARLSTRTTRPDPSMKTDVLLESVQHNSAPDNTLSPLIIGVIIAWTMRRLILRLEICIYICRASVVRREYLRGVWLVSGD